MRYTVKSRQSLLDIALMTCGSCEDAFALAERNNVSITGELRPGTLLEYRAADVTNAETVETLSAYGAAPATAITKDY